MDMAKSTGVFYFQIEGMNRIRKNNNQIVFLKGEFVVINIHGALSGIDQIDFY